MNAIFKFDNSRFFCGYNCKEAELGDRGLFFNYFDDIEDVIKSNFDSKNIFELVKTKKTNNNEKCFCHLDEKGNEIWANYFYRVESKDASFPDTGYTEKGAVCCETCKHGTYSDDDTYYCHRNDSGGRMVSESGLCYLWERNNDN